MDDLSINDGRYSGGFERPQTSHGQRGPSSRRDPPRPSTSHDRRPDMSAPPYQPQMPLPGRQSPEISRQYQDVRPQGNRASPPRPPMQQQPVGTPQSRGPPPQSRPRPGQYNELNSYGYQTGPNPNSNGQGHSRSQRDDYGLDEGYQRDHIPQSMAHQSPIEPRGRNNLQRAATFEDFGPPPRAMTTGHVEQGGYRGVPPAGLGQTRSHEMPNFDAIPTRQNEKVDELFGSSSQSHEQRAYQKPVYQVPGSYPNQGNARHDQADPQELVSPLAEFSFDLPPSINQRPMTPSRNDAGSMPDGYRHPYQHGEQRAYDQRPGRSDGFEEFQRQQTPSQHPPRAASRNGMKPQMNDGSRPPPIPVTAPGYRSFSEGQYPRGQVNNASRPEPRGYDMGNPYDSESQQDERGLPGLAGQVPDWNQSAPNQPYQQQQKQQYGQGLPTRTTSQDSYRPGPPGPPQPSYTNNAHPVPVRHYGTPAAVSNNPDALPAHPEPVRQGTGNFSNGYGAPSGAGGPQPGPPPAPPANRQVPGPGTNGRTSPSTITLQEVNGLREAYSRTPNDYALGLKLSKKLVEAARVLSDEGGAADAKQTQKNRERYIFDAHKLVKKLVAANYTEAMFYLADCHGQGLLGFAVDPREAFHLYQSAAKLNHPQSAYRVAVCCELGQEDGGGTRRDPMKAMQWYKRAATLGDPPAMYKMGMILLKGHLNQQKSPREAVSWLKRAAERADKDNPHALHELGLLYESATPTDHIVKDERYSIQLFQQAAELGYKYSQFRLGSAYEYGLLGCPIDARQSIAWYTRAAAQGEHQSELALSGWYLTGSEPLLTQSDTEAFLWARKAASSGLAKAEYAMGYFFEVGIGTGVDIEEAKRWYYRAACKFPLFGTSNGAVTNTDTAQNFAKARERLEELKRGGQRQQKTRVSRTNVKNDGDCTVM
jgi:TPR repeat protein